MLKDKIGSVTVLFRGSQANFPDTNEWTKTILEWLTWIGAAGSALIAIISVFVSEASAKQVAFTIAIVLGVIFGLAFYYRCRQHGHSIFNQLHQPIPVLRCHY